MLLFIMSTTRKNIYWNLGLVLISLMTIGLYVDFRIFDDIDVQLHDTYFVTNSLHAIFLLSGLLITFRYFYLLVDVLTTKNRIFALIASFVFGITLILIISITVMTIAVNNILSQIDLASILTLTIELALITYFGLLEIVSVKRTFRLIRE